MRRSIFNFYGMATLSLGLLLLATPGVLSQMRSGMAGQNGNTNQNGNMNQPGMSPNMQPNGPMAMQNNAEVSCFANMRRNSKVETDLSKLALKNSSNDDIKKLAQQVISENRQNEMALTSTPASNANAYGLPPTAPVPSQTHQAEKEMKKLTGTQFDAMYLSQMKGYVENDQKLVSDASSTSNSADIGSLTMRLRNTTDQRAKQIAQIAQSENIKIQ
jgi:uncharacterized protein (DUF305 family)